MTWRKASVPKKNTPMRAAVLADENEIPDNHVLTVRDRALSTDLERIVQNNVKTDTVTLDLDGEWDDCTVYVTFNDETARSGPWSLEWKGQPLTIPSAIGAVVGPVAVSVVGYGSDGGLRLVTEAAPSLLDVVKSGYVEIVDDNEENKDVLSQMVAAGKKAEDAAEAANAAASARAIEEMRPAPAEGQRGPVIEVEVTPHGGRGARGHGGPDRGGLREGAPRVRSGL